MFAQLPTEKMSEREFRKVAGLCGRCGVGRREPNSLCELCAQVDALKMLKIKQPRKQRRAA